MVQSLSYNLFEAEISIEKMPLIPYLPDRKTEKRKDPPKFLRKLPQNLRLKILVDSLKRFFRNKKFSFDKEIDLSILTSVLPSPRDVYERELEWSIDEELAKFAAQQKSSLL